MAPRLKGGVQPYHSMRSRTQRVWVTPSEVHQNQVSTVPSASTTPDGLPKAIFMCSARKFSCSGSPRVASSPASNTTISFSTS